MCDHWKPRRQLTTELLVHLGGTLEEIRVKVEDTTEIRLMTGRMTEKEAFNSK